MAKRKNRKLQPKHLLLGAALIILVPAVTFFYLRSRTVAHLESPGGSLTSEQASNIEACGDGALFDTIPMAFNDFRSFRPLGFVTIPIHIFGAKHSNFSINLPGEHVSGKPVKFPSNATVTAITSTESASGKGYQMTFYPCREFKSYFFHLGTISESLQQEFDQGNPKCQEFTFDSSGKITKCELITEIKVKSNELAGTSDTFAGVDWGAVDYRVTAEYANPDRYDGDYPHYTSPLLYLREDLQKIIYTKLGSPDGTVKRTQEPRVGQLAQDIKGTAQGNWFIGDQNFKNTQDFSPFMALTHDYIDPNQPIFSMGTSVKGLNKGIYSFTVQASGLNNRDFGAVKPDGQVYCYDSWKSGYTYGLNPLTSTTGAIIMAMPSATQLKVEKISGNCTSSKSFSSSATIFDR